MPVPVEIRGPLKPRIVSRISDWATGHCPLGADSYIKGNFKPDMVPFFISEMDAAMDYRLRELCVVTSAQVGKTQTFFSILKYFAVEYGYHSMIVFADESTSRFMAENRLIPLFEGDGESAALIDRKKWRPSEGTYAIKNGAVIETGWATSVPKMGSRSKGVVYADEFAKYRRPATSKEASAISLLEERLNTFPDSKFFKSSTPTDKGSFAELEKCDLIYDWHVPCPYCGRYQPLRWDRGYAYGFDEEDYTYLGDDGERHPLGRVVWDGGRSATKPEIKASAAYECGECGERWTNAQRIEAVRRGKDVPRWPAKGWETSRGKHVNRLYSLFPGGDLDRIVSKWVSIVGMDDGPERDEEFRGFVNSTLAEPYEDQTLGRKIDPLGVLGEKMTDLPPLTVPAEAVALTCAVDCQGFGFPYLVRAWMRDKTSYLVDFGLIEMDARVIRSVDDMGVLRELFERTWPVHGSRGARMGIWRGGIDTGGTRLSDDPDAATMTELAYEFVRTFGRGRVFALKGATSFHQTKKVWSTKIGELPMRGGKRRKIPGGITVFMLDVNRLKDLVHARAIMDRGAAGTLLLHRETTAEYAHQLFAEYKRRDPKTGLTRWQQKRGVRNEALDLEVYSAALTDEEFLGGIRLCRAPQCLHVGDAAVDRPRAQHVRRTSKRMW